MSFLLFLIYILQTTHFGPFHCYFRMFPRPRCRRYGQPPTRPTCVPKASVKFPILKCWSWWKMPRKWFVDKTYTGLRKLHTKFYKTEFAGSPVQGIGKKLVKQNIMAWCSASIFCESPIVLHGLVQSDIFHDPSETASMNVHVWRDIICVCIYIYINRNIYKFVCKYKYIDTCGYNDVYPCNVSHLYLLYDCMFQ